MIKVLKNDKPFVLHINGFRGRNLYFKSKASKKFDMEDEEQAAEYRLWQERWGELSGNNPFCRDITIRFPELNPGAKFYQDGVEIKPGQ